MLHFNMKTFTVSALSLLLRTCLAAPHPEPANPLVPTAPDSGPRRPAHPMVPRAAAGEDDRLNALVPRSLATDVWRADDMEAAGDAVSTPTEDFDAPLGDDDDDDDDDDESGELPPVGVEEGTIILDGDGDGDGVNVTDTEDAAPTLQRRQTACGLPYCKGETSFYDFKPGDIFFCDRVVGRRRNSWQDKIVALPGFEGLLDRSLCGATITLTWNGRSTTAKVGDRCPDISCVSHISSSSSPSSSPS